MKSLLSKLTMVDVPVEGGQEGERTAEVLARGTGSPRPATRRQEQVSIFIRPQALTFPVVVGIVKVGWEGIQRLPISWGGRYGFLLPRAFSLGY
jgi:hypothetical protein